jgi:hypothetical protein
MTMTRTVIVGFVWRPRLPAAGVRRLLQPVGRGLTPS